MPDVVSLGQVRQLVNVTDSSEDEDLTRLIGVATGNLRAMTGGPLFTETITDERVRTDSDLALILKQRPLVDVQLVKAVWSGIPISITDLDIDRDNGIVRRRSMWPFLGGTNAYLVTYTAGWGETAADNPLAFYAFQEAALVIVGKLWEIERGPAPGMPGWTEGTAEPRPSSPFIPGAAFTVPNRALEVMRPYTREAWV